MDRLIFTTLLFTLAVLGPGVPVAHAQGVDELPPMSVAFTQIDGLGFWSVNGVIVDAPPTQYGATATTMTTSGGGGGGGTPPLPGVTLGRGQVMMHPAVMLETQLACGSYVMTQGWTWQAPDWGLLNVHTMAVQQGCDIQELGGPWYNPPGGTVAPAPSYITTSWTDEAGNVHTVHTRKKTGETLEMTIHRHSQWVNAALEEWPPAGQGGDTSKAEPVRTIEVPWGRIELARAA